MAQVTRESIPALNCAQIALYVMCGGGRLGRLAAESPGTFIIPPAVPRLPYPRRVIYAAAAWLTDLARSLDLDPCALPPMPNVTFNPARGAPPFPAPAVRLTLVRSSPVNDDPLAHQGEAVS